MQDVIILTARDEHSMHAQPPPGRHGTRSALACRARYTLWPTYHRRYNFHYRGVLAQRVLFLFDAGRRAHIKMHHAFSRHSLLGAVSKTSLISARANILRDAMMFSIFKMRLIYSHCHCFTLARALPRRRINIIVKISPF